MPEKGKKLTEDLILAKTKSINLSAIKNLNLWGNQLEDLRIIKDLPNIEVISLSVNRIKTLSYFQPCEKLQELYLRKNEVQDIKQIKYLKDLPLLKILWLHDNPCTEIKNYRLIVIKYLIHLVKLDNNPVTKEERDNCQQIYFDLGQIKSNEDCEQVSKQQTDKNEDKNIQISDKRQKQQEGKQQTPKLPTRKKWGQKSISMEMSPVSLKKNSLIDLPQPQINTPFKRSRPKFSRQEKMQKAKQLPTIQHNFQRNQNVLMAILSLMRQLDPASLQIVIKQADKMSRPS